MPCVLAWAAGAGCSPDLRQQAAAAYARLLLQNKLKLQGMLGVVGEVLAGADRKVCGLCPRTRRLWQEPACHSHAYCMRIIPDPWLMHISESQPFH